MTRGHVDLKVIGDRLAIVAGCLDELRSLPLASLAEFQGDPRNSAAAESFLRRALEALLDVARHLLAKTAGEGPLEYRQVALRAAERGLVVAPDLAAKFPLLAGYRNRLTHFYAEVTSEELFQIITTGLMDVERIADELRRATRRLTETGS